MPLEIERKFLVRDESWRQHAGPGQALRQGYVLRGEGRSLRVRLAAGKAWLTVKGEAPDRHEGSTRLEFEYDIPVEDAEAMLETLCARPLLEKTRYRVPYEGLVWEVDVFAGHAQGLVLAEVELDHADQPVTIPPWAGREVTDDPRYRNAAIVDHVPALG